MIIGDNSNYKSKNNTLYLKVSYKYLSILLLLKGMIGMKQCKVFYENWQMECCGSPFKLGDTIEWLVYEADDTDSETKLGKVEYCYEGHSSHWQTLSVLKGTIKNIKLSYAQENQYSLDDKSIDWKLIEAKEAHDFEKPLLGFWFKGYLVTLDDYTIRPAKEEEVRKDFIWDSNDLLKTMDLEEIDTEFLWDSDDIPEMLDLEELSTEFFRGFNDIPETLDLTELDIYETLEKE